MTGVDWGPGLTGLYIIWLFNPIKAISAKITLHNGLDKISTYTNQ